MEPASSLTLSALFFCVTLCARAVFSFLETSITALRLFKLKELAKRAKQYHYLFHELEAHPHRVLMTILIANSVTDVVTAALATDITQVLFARLGFSSGWGFTCGIGVASLAIIIFGEILPKSIARSKGEKLFSAMLGFVNDMYRLFYPITALFLLITNKFTQLLSGKEMFNAEGAWVSSEKEVRFLVEYIHEKGLIDPEKTVMLQNIFDLSTTYIKDAMIAAPEVVRIDVHASLEDVLELFSEYQYTRLPAYDKHRDNIIGMIHLKDVFLLISKGEQKSLREIVRPIMFVTPEMSISQLLQQFRAQHMHIAIVINAQKQVVGLVTLEDVLEEIVGDIRDEHESE